MQVRVAPSLGELEGTHQEVWGTENYQPSSKPNEPTVFMGLYGLPDFYTLWRHKGKRYIFWVGSDIRHFINGYWLDDEGKIRINPKSLAKWINENCESWVENLVEKKALEIIGIKAKRCPSFMGNIKDYKVEYKWSNKPKLYTSVSGDDFDLYGWHQVDYLAKQYPNYEFHLYGNQMDWESKNDNVIVHGRVHKDIMNDEIKHMQGALRLVELEGFSEIIAKSILWGQWPISLISYRHTLSVDKMDMLRKKHTPNFAGRQHYLQRLNKFPWNTKGK